ncbi:MAG TPA: hypothetical protein VFR06_04865, partial [Gallionellaceae bacterium]|nr:hypothetical protein [Gallionellaceae bacterium]
VLALPYVWPLESYIAPLEQELEAQLHQPVHIGKLSAAWSPAPRLEMHGVTVGRAQEVKIGEAEINFDFSALFSPTRSISTLKLSKVNLNGVSVIPAMGWMRAAGAMEKYPVAKVQLEEVRVASEEIKVPELNGQAAFDAQGNFTKAELKSGDSKLGLELEAVQKHLQLVVSFRDMALPTLPNISFKDLTATGEILNGEIAFSDLYGHLYGGMLGGNARLNWSNGWLLQGRLVAKSLELQELLPKQGLSGELYGDVNFTLSGDRLSRISEAPRMEGTFEAKQVTINKMDLETMARFGGRSDLARGRTNFDVVSGTLQADSLGQHLHQFKFSSSVMSGSGQLDVSANQQMNGKLSLELTGPHGGNATMLISGTPAEPAVKVR